MNHDTSEIVWAPRVPMELMRRLYASDAANLRDEDLLNEVGWGLYARAQSVVDVNRAHDQRIARCPRCGKDAPLKGKSGFGNAAFCCPCGFSVSQKAYHLTYKAKQLTGSSIVPFAKDFMRDWARARRDTDAQMRAVDALLHRFHWEMEGRASRPVAVNFIQGSLPEVFYFICELARAGTPEWEDERQKWDKNVEIFRKLVWREDGEGK